MIDLRLKTLESEIESLKKQYLEISEIIKNIKKPLVVDCKTETVDCKTKTVDCKQLISDFIAKYNLDYEWSTNKCLCASDYVLSFEDIHYIMENNLRFEDWSKVYWQAIETDNKESFKTNFEKWNMR
jgi:hypothetical protein